jgi:hypothetical protein
LQVGQVDEQIRFPLRRLGDGRPEISPSATPELKPSQHLRAFTSRKIIETIFRRQEPASAIVAASRRQSTNADQLAPDLDDRAWTGEEIVEREPRQIGFIQVLSDPIEVCRNQCPWDEATIRYAGSAIAHRSRNTEFGSYGRHCLSFL